MNDNKFEFYEHNNELHLFYWSSVCNVKMKNILKTTKYINNLNNSCNKILSSFLSRNTSL